MGFFAFAPIAPFASPPPNPPVADTDGGTGGAFGAPAIPVALPEPNPPEGGTVGGGDGVVVGGAGGLGGTVTLGGETWVGTRGREGRENVRRPKPPNPPNPPRRRCASAGMAVVRTEVNSSRTVRSVSRRVTSDAHFLSSRRRALRQRGACECRVSGPASPHGRA